MAGRGVAFRWRRFIVAAVALHALVMVVARFEHHDLLCHLKTPQHCVSCSTNPAGLASSPPTVSEGHPLADVGRAFAAVATGDDVLLASVSSGRSPPSSV